MKPILNISHNDLDGIGCTIISKLVFGDRIETRNISNMSANELNAFYEEVIANADKYDTIFITDLIVPIKAAAAMNKYNKEHGEVFILIDHHKTNVDSRNYDWAHILPEDMSETDTPQCGTSIYYDLLDAFISEERWPRIFSYDDSIENYVNEAHGNKAGTRLKNFVELVRLWDTFAWTKCENKRLAKEAVLMNELYSHTSQDFIRNLIATGDSSGTSEASKTVIPPAMSSFLTAMDDASTAGLARRISKYRTDFFINVNQDGEAYQFLRGERPEESPRYKTYRGMLFVGTQYAGNIRAAIEYIMNSEENPEGWPEDRIDMFMIWDIDKGQFQIRSSNSPECDFDAGSFAKYYGGGGHTKASGITYGKMYGDSITGECCDMLAQLKEWIF